MMGLFNIIQ